MKCLKLAVAGNILIFIFSRRNLVPRRAFCTEKARPFGRTFSVWLRSHSLPGANFPRFPPRPACRRLCSGRLSHVPGCSGIMPLRRPREPSDRCIGICSDEGGCRLFEPVHPFKVFVYCSAFRTAVFYQIDYLRRRVFVGGCQYWINSANV